MRRAVPYFPSLPTLRIDAQAGGTVALDVATGKALAHGNEPT